MWLDCEIQLAGSPEHRERYGINIQVETIDGQHHAVTVAPAALRYDIRQFYAQPAWGVEGPADCYQTGPGYVHCDPQRLIGQGVGVLVETGSPGSPARPFVVSFSQLTETGDIVQRLSA